MASIRGERSAHHSMVAMMKTASISILAAAQAGTYSISSSSGFADTELPFNLSIARYRPIPEIE
ncbi:hypothetical protein EQZ23_08465 [Sphingomonas sp. UV9]|uniref:hypothetical protein n=1 Tax=Sphingomonas sp. UV9 TaxID=1851410 RepID=UPI000FFBB8FA|nr:hypothetical protein [Sphingomonas sp. UV9]RXD05139.1 hypothetical protein EQZ23_08465 [Sphingomonas sp. UV9]